MPRHSKMSFSLPAILPVGTAVVVATRVGAHPTHPRGAAGVITQAPLDWEHAYRVRFPGGEEASFLRHEIEVLTHFQAMAAGEGGATNLRLRGLHDRVVLRIVIGSRAYGLDHAGSDFDRRGVYVPRAVDHWSLAGVPEQLEDDATQECYWEIGKFIALALKGNPNVLECLWSPLVEEASGAGAVLLAKRKLFLSQLVYPTFNGYAQSQFKKLGTDLKNHGEIKWQHAMHLIRLLLSGIEVVKTGELPVRVEGPHKDRLLAIRAGAEKWEAVDAWRLQLHAEFEEAFKHTRLSERPDYAGANEVLVEARRGAVGK